MCRPVPPQCDWASASCALFSAMRASSACHDFAKRRRLRAAAFGERRVVDALRAANRASTASASPPSTGSAGTDLAVVGEGVQRLLRHRVDRVGRRERLDVQRVGRGRVLGAGAGPQQPLRIGRRRAASFCQRGDASSRGTPCRCAARSRCRGGCAAAARHLVLHRHVPAADEQRGDRRDLRVEPGRDAPLDAAQVGLGRRRGTARARTAASR